MLVIETGSKLNSIVFKNIEKRQCFIYEGRLYIKINANLIYCFTENKLDSFHSNTKVELVTLTLSVEENEKC